MRIMVQTAGFLNSRRLESIVRIKSLITTQIIQYWPYYLFKLSICQVLSSLKDDKAVTVFCDVPQFPLGFFVQKPILQTECFLCMITAEQEMNQPLTGWAERFPLRVCSGFAPARRWSHLRDMRESRLCVFVRVGSGSGTAEFKNLNEREVSGC